MGHYWVPQPYMATWAPPVRARPRVRTWARPVPAVLAGAVHGARPPIHADRCAVYVISFKARPTPPCFNGGVLPGQFWAVAKPRYLTN